MESSHWLGYKSAKQLDLEKLKDMHICDHVFQTQLLFVLLSTAFDGKK